MSQCIEAAGHEIEPSKQRGLLKVNKVKSGRTSSPYLGFKIFLVKLSIRQICSLLLLSK